MMTYARQIRHKTDKYMRSGVFIIATGIECYWPFQDAKSKVLVLEQLQTSTFNLSYKVQQTRGLRTASYKLMGGGACQ